VTSGAIGWTADLCGVALLPLIYIAGVLHDTRIRGAVRDLDNPGGTSS
jgi:hypothetical protein